MAPLVAVIVLNWNRRAETLECLKSLVIQTYPSCQIAMVDNGSTDGSASAVHLAFPEVTVLENSTNLGFSEGNNVGIRWALERGAEYVLLLNNDTVADAAMVEHLVTAMELDDRIGAAGPKILYYSEPQRLWSAGGIMDYTETVSRSRGYRQLDRGQFDVTGDVDFVSGCALCLRRTAIERVGLLDPVFSPAYFEDTDWCVRARRCGYRVVYVPQAKVWHKVSLSSGGEYNVKERYLLGYNSVVFMKRYANAAQWVKYLFYALGTLPVVYMVRVFQGRGRAVLAKGLGIVDGLRGVRRDTFPRLRI